MSSFTTPLVVTPDANGKHWILVESFEYHIGSKESTDIIVIPKGFVTDFASIPQILWNILPPFGTYGKAAVVHDWLYCNLGFNKYSRKQCDQIFLEGMVVLNVGKFTRWLIYNNVRWFGGFAWNNYTKKNAKKET